MSNQKFKLQCHLLGETFPDKFLVVFAFDKAVVGTPDQKADVICNPQTEAEFNAFHTIMRGANAAPYDWALRRFRKAINSALEHSDELPPAVVTLLEDVLAGRDPA